MNTKSRHISRYMAIFFTIAVLFPLTSRASAPTTVNYQGYLSDSSGNPVTNTSPGVDIDFYIFDAQSGGTVLWNESQTGIPVVNGLFNIQLGSVTPLLETYFPNTPNISGSFAWLEIAVNGDPPMTPRQEINSVIYALRSAISDTSIYARDSDKVDGVDASDLEESIEIVNAVNAHKAGPSEHHSKTTDFSELTNGQVTTGQITDNAVTSPKIADGTVSSADVGFNYAGSSSKGGAAASTPWSGLTGVPAGFADGVDNTGIASEADPQVGSNTLNFIPRWDGAALVTGSIFDNGAGNIGIGTTSVTEKLTVNGNLFMSGGDIKTDRWLLSDTNTGVGVGVFGAGNLSHTLGNTGWYNTAVGMNALFSNTAGNYNTANGYNALFSNTTGIRNTANGMNALYFNTAGNYNTANGYNALYFNTTGNYNTANGDSALLYNITGWYNTANGYSALYSNTTGGNNTANGYSALISNTTGGANTANGVVALSSNTTGDGNIALGYLAGSNITSGSRNIIIGYNIDAPSAAGSNQMSIGNLIYATGVDGTGTTVSTGNVGIGTSSPAYKLHINGTAAGTSWTNLSSREYKEDIKPVDASKHSIMLASLMDMELTNYRYKEEFGGDGATKLGFIAEEMPKEVLSKDGKGVDVYELIAYTIGAMKAQQKEIKAQTEKNKAQEEEIKGQKDEIKLLKAALQQNEAMKEEISRIKAALGL